MAVACKKRVSQTNKIANSKRKQCKETHEKRKKEEKQRRKIMRGKENSLVASWRVCGICEQDVLLFH